jgi:hypothetical protein
MERFPTVTSSTCWGSERFHFAPGPRPFLTSRAIRVPHRRVDSRYPWVAATIGASPAAGTAAFTKGSTGGITVQAGQGLRPEPQGEAAHRGGQGTGQQAREPSQGQGVRTALHEEALAPSLASADAVVVDGCRAVHEPSAAGKVCREPFGLLPTRRYVTDDQPHPPDSWSRRRHVRIIVVLARPCHPRAIGSGHQRYVADSHGHSAWTVHQDRPLLTWRSGTARHCMACRRSGVQIPSVAPQVRAIIRPPSASDSTNPSRTAVARSASAIVTCSARTNRSTCGAIPTLPATSLEGSRAS